MNEVKRIYPLKITRLKKDKLKYLHIEDEMKENVPSKVDLSSHPFMPPVYDQGQLGSCTANALCSAVNFNIPQYPGSRLFLYYNERFIEGTTNTDDGAYLYDGVKALKKWGLCKECVWPYDISKFAIKPSHEAYHDNDLQPIVKNQIKEFNISNDLISMKFALHNSWLFVVGILIYESFESEHVSKTGIVSMPDIEKENMLGGHAVVCVGYDDSTQMWKMRNSWGSSWGDKGYFYLPYEYLLSTHLASDLWYIKKE